MDLFDVAAKISLDTKGYERGLDEASAKTSSFAEKLGNGLKTAAQVGAAAITAAATAATALGTAAIKSYGEYEQLVGGAKLMFGDAYDFIAQKAQNAFATVQMSQNDYLQQVNGLATGLKTALNDNEKAAAELADRIITAEADVVAATGASQEAVQNAFNGIMKSNYTMLDNLQIGIKPTKEGFQEVIDKVNEWNAANGEATNYQIDNLADAQAALVDYIEMVGMAGYANREAADTIQGSMAAAKAAWSNLLTGLADDEADLEKLIDNVVVTVSQVGKNIMPRVETVLDGIGKLIDTLLPQIVEKIPGLINKYLPKLIESGAKIIASLVSGILGDSANLISAAQTAIRLIVDTIIELLPELVKAGGNIITELIVGLSKMLPELVDAAIEMIQQLLETLTDTSNLSLILDAVLTVIMSVANKMIEALPTIIEAVMQIIASLVDFLTGDALPSMIEAGITLFTALVGALPEIINAIVSALPQIVDGILNAITENLPLIIQGGIQLFTSLVGALPEIIATIVDVIPQIIGSIVRAIFENLPTLIQGGIDMFVALIEELPTIIKMISVAIPQIIEGVVTAITDNIDVIIMAGVQLFVALIENLPQIIIAIVSAVPEIIDGIVEAFNSLIGSIVSVGESLIKGIWEGIKKAGTWLWDKVSGFFNDLIGDIKDLLGIHSPSTVFAGFGKYMAQGLGIGFGDGMDKATNSMLNDLKAMRNKAENELSGFDISGEISTGRYNSNIRKFTGGVNITQNIYSQAMTAADVMEEALYRQREAILFGV